MSTPEDFIKMWRHMAETVERVPAGWSELQIPAPLRQHLELLEQALQAQADFNRELIERGLAPMRDLLTGLEQAVESTRQAGASLRQAGELLEQQASIMQHALARTRPLKAMLDVTERRPTSQQ
jgi:hypothetical protein